MNNWNTKEKGVLRFFFYKKQKYYVGVCLNLDIVEYGKDPKELIKSVQEGAVAVLEAVQKNKLSDELLNKPAPKEQWDRFNKYISNLKTRSQLCDIKEDDYSSLINNPYTNKGLFTNLC